jgi:hypothetical protein
MSTDRLLLVGGQVASARRMSFEARRALLYAPQHSMPRSAAVVSGHLAQPLTLAQSDPIAAASAGDRGGGCGAYHAASHLPSGSVDGDSLDGTYAAFADGSPDRGTSAL